MVQGTKETDQLMDKEKPLNVKKQESNDEDSLSVHMCSFAASKILVRVVSEMINSAIDHHLLLDHTF